MSYGPTDLATLKEFIKILILAAEEGEMKKDISLLFPMLNYCILVGCSLHTKSDIMQDDVNCPITLSWKR